MKKRTRTQKNINTLYRSPFVLLLFLVMFAAVGIALLKFSFADYDHSPLGFVDYCQLENNRTILYGWAADSDASPGPLPNVVAYINGGGDTAAATSIGGYREAEINEYLAARGIPPSGPYGFRIELGSLYKGTTYGLSGVIINLGQGANSSLVVNNFRTVDGKPNFPGNNIPDACLATLQVAPPSPNPTITPRPNPSPRTNPLAPAAPAALSTNADGVATAGSFATSIQIPNGNAEKVRIIYGTNEQTPDLSSDTFDVTPDSTTVLLTNLKPAATYYYQIMRLKNDGSSVTSSTANFKTKGLDVVLTFKNGDQQVPGIEAEIKRLGLSGKADEKGIMTLHEVPTGLHNLTFQHEGKDFQKQLAIYETSTQPEAQKTPIVGIAPLDIQLQEETQPTNAKPAKKGGNKLGLVLLVILILALIVGAIFWFIRRRRTAQAYDDSSYLPSALGTTPPFPQPNAVPPPVANPAPRTGPPQAHSGESLKDLVIQSMREEAARKQAEANKNNQTPPETR